MTHAEIINSLAELAKIMAANGISRLELPGSLILIRPELVCLPEEKKAERTSWEPEGT